MLGRTNAGGGGGLNFKIIAYATETGTSTILGPLVAGVIAGSCYGLLLRASAYTGGTDFIAKLIHKKNPSFNFFTIMGALVMVVGVVSVTRRQRRESLKSFVPLNIR